MALRPRIPTRVRTGEGNIGQGSGKKQKKLIAPSSPRQEGLIPSWLVNAIARVKHDDQGHLGGGDHGRDC